MPAYHARVAFEAHNTGSGALITNVLHVEVDVLTDPPNWTSIANDIHTWLGQPYSNVLTVADSFDQIVVSDENYPGSTHGQGVHAVGAVGTRSYGDAKLAAGLCVLGSFKTAVAKRYGRGHMFFPPALDTTELAQGGLFAQSGTYWVAAQAFLTAFLAGHTASSTGYTPEIFSRHLVALGQTPFANKITSGALKPRQSYLRSRETAP